jgi:CRP-like cAMP-binding protein
MKKIPSSFMEFINSGQLHNKNICAEIEDKIQIKSINKKEIIQRKGDKNLKAYFVKSGLLKSYALDKKGKEHIFMFAPENWILTEFNSFAHHGETELYIEAIENTLVEIIPKDAYDLIAGDKNNNHIIEVQKLLKRNAVLQKRIISLMSKSAIERYEDFIKTYPQIVQRVPQKMIASYLGITPQALSKSISQSAKHHNINLD